MKQVPIISILIVIQFFYGCSGSKQENEQTINPLLGDISFVSKFGRQPTLLDDENVRIKTHLEYAENLLRQRTTPDLGEEQKKKRNLILDLLHDYWTTGVFPGNYDYTGKRVPCFIDKNGNICAVGYLIERTAGRETAEQINNGHKYDKLLAMNDPAVDSWIEESGLTKEECAMIQPTYGTLYHYSNNYISPEFGIASSLLGGVNLSLNTINTIQISNGAKNKLVAKTSLFTGAISIIYGGFKFSEGQNYHNYLGTNESQKALSMFNIGFGTTTMILAIWNLSVNRQKKARSTSWNFNSYLTPTNQVGICMNLVRRI